MHRLSSLAVLEPSRLVKRAILRIAVMYFARRATGLLFHAPKQPIQQQSYDFSSLPDALQIEILKTLPLVDRLHTRMLSKALSVLTAGPSPVWEELVIDCSVQSQHFQQFDEFCQWLVPRSTAVKVLVLKGLQIPASPDALNPLKTGILGSLLSNHLQASLTTLTITECSTAVGEEEFAAFAACQHLTALIIETESQIHPACVSSISSLTDLQHLELKISPGDRKSSPNVTEYQGFPQGLVQLTALSSLRLSGWTFIPFVPPCNVQWSNVSKLAVTHCALMAMSPAMQSLQNLQSLDLSSNCLGHRRGERHISPLSSLTNLTCLKLSNNSFAELPVGLSKLTALKCFHFAANQLKSTDTLSPVLSNLTGLSKLILQQCGLNVVPDGLAALSGLRWLCLSRNNLQVIPRIMPWRRLQVLHLRGNELRAVPCAALWSAGQLMHLDCGDNFPLQVESKALQRLVTSRLPCLRGLYIDKDGSPEVPNDVKWTQKSLATIAELDPVFSTECAQLDFYAFPDV